MKKLGFDLILLGDPASGKDTQAELLANGFDLKLVGSGEYLRKNMKRKDRLGRLIRDTVGRAKPAPVSLIKQFLKNEVTKAPKSKNLVFVGTPRLKPEAQFLVKFLKQKKRDYLALYINLPVKEILKRSYSRLRHDDLKAASIRKRIKWHKEQMGKTLDYFRRLEKLREIDGNKSIVKVALSICKAINECK